MKEQLSETSVVSHFVHLSIFIFETVLRTLSQSFNSEAIVIIFTLKESNLKVEPVQEQLRETAAFCTNI